MPDAPGDTAAELRAANARLRELLAGRDAEVAGLRALVAGLQAQVADLAARLGQNSANSSKPPSSDGLAKPAPKYCVNAAAGDCMDPATGNGFVTTTDPDGNTAVDDYTDGVLAAETSITAGTVTSETDNNPMTSTGGPMGGTLLESSITDGDGHSTSFTYDSSDDIVTTTDPAGKQFTKWSTALRQPSCTGQPTASIPCSSSQPGPAPVTPGSTIRPPSSPPPAGVVYTLYDTEGNQLYSSYGVYPSGSSSSSATLTDYTLYKGDAVTLNGSSISCATVPPSPSLRCATISAQGLVTQISYDAQGDVTGISAPDGNGSEVATTTYTYDADGEQGSKTTADGNLPGANAGNYTTVTNYNGDGQITSVTQAGGPGATVTPRATLYQYDADKNRTSVTDARGYTTLTAYDADDGPSLVTDPLGHQTLTCYDGDGHITQTVPPVGVAAGSLTPANCPTAYAYPSTGYGHRLAADATTWTYNADGNKTEMTTPAPAGQSGYETTTYIYDGAGNTTTINAPPASDTGPNQDTADTYTPDNRLATETVGYGTAAQSTTSYCYDPDGNKTSVVSPDGNAAGVAPCETSAPWIVSAAYPVQAAYQTISNYDSSDELTATTRPATSAAPGGATSTYTYGPTGTLAGSTTPGGVTATMTYNAVGLLTGVSYSGSAAPSVSYTYDAQQNIVTRTDGTGGSSVSYDPFGEVTSITNGARQTVSYSYDANGDTTGITYPLTAAAAWASSNTVGYGYDKNNRLNSVTDFNGQQISITNNSDELPASESLGSTGDTLNYSYDQTDTPSSISLANGTSALQSFGYADTPDARIETETDTPSTAQSPANYAYDTQGRLTSVTPGTSSPLSYGYDASGNLNTLPIGATASYDHAGELTSSSLGGTSTSYSYNADGDRTAVQQGSATAASAGWNGVDELTAYNGATASMSGASYDASGLRVGDTVTPAGGSAAPQQFTWDANNDNLLMDSGNAYIYGNGTAPAEEVNLSSGNVTYLVTDALGSVRGAVNSTGSLAATTSYDAWGNPQTAGGLTSYTPFGYAGGYTDPTGLIYLIHRYYDPSTGQFMSVDPEVNTTSEPYAYAGGDPVDGADPLGEWTVRGWCTYCGFNEKTWNAILYVVMAQLGGLVGATVTKAPRTAMQTPFIMDARIPDIYWLSPKNRIGWINELKVGYVSMSTGQAGKEVADDYRILHAGGAKALSGPLKGKRVPVDLDIWWFLPNPVGLMQVSAPLETALEMTGINSIQISEKPGAPPLRKSQTKKQAEQEAKELESGDETEEQEAIDTLIGPPGLICIP